MDYKYEKYRIYACDEKGVLVAKAEFTDVGEGLIEINHVYASPALRGQGIAGQMMETVVQYMRKNSLKALASCSYASSWLQKNMDSCADVVADGNEQLPIACKIDGQH